MRSAASAREAHGALRQLGGLFVPGRGDSPLSELLPIIEAKLREREPTVLDAEGRPGATVSSVVMALMDEAAAITSMSKSSGPSASSDDFQRGEMEPRPDAIEAALRTPVFKEIARRLERADLSTEAGRQEAVMIAFDPKCPLTIRAVCRPLRSAAVLSRVPALAMLSDLHGSVPAYFTFLLMASKSTKQVADHLKPYTIQGIMDAHGEYPPEGVAFMKDVLDFKWATADWVYSPGGLMARRTFLNGAGRNLQESSASQIMGARVAECHPLDVYTKRSVVEDLGGFINQILMGFGCPNSVDDEATEGVPFSSFLSFYLDHLDVYAHLIGGAVPVSGSLPCHVFASSQKDK